jgi:copper chaperone
MTASSPIQFSISGMSCGHCVAAVKKALGTVPGVASDDVAIGSATVTVAPGADADKVRADAVRAIEDAGYEARSAA